MSQTNFAPPEKASRNLNRFRSQGMRGPGREVPAEALGDGHLEGEGGRGPQHLLQEVTSGLPAKEGGGAYKLGTS